MNISNHSDIPESIERVSACFLIRYFFPTALSEQDACFSKRTAYNTFSYLIEQITSNFNLFSSIFFNDQKQKRLYFTLFSSISFCFVPSFSFFFLTFSFLWFSVGGVIYDIENLSLKPLFFSPILFFFFF